MDNEEKLRQSGIQAELANRNDPEYWESLRIDTEGGFKDRLARKRAESLKQRAKKYGVTVEELRMSEQREQAKKLRGD